MSHLARPSPHATSRQPQIDDDANYRTDLLASIDPTAALTTDAEIVERVAALVQAAYRRQWWLLLLDATGVQVPAVPQVEMPPRFGEKEAERFAQVLTELTAEVAAVVLVWELPRAQPHHPGPSMLAAAMKRRGAQLRAQLLIDADGDIRLWEP